MKNSYNYINGLGIYKKICIFKNKDDTYSYTIWNMENGDFCGSRENVNEKEIMDFLTHYHIKP